ncbi:MAG: hypothetical protein QXZ36_03670 [Thermoproteota archaeon]
MPNNNDTIDTGSSGSAWSEQIPGIFDKIFKFPWPVTEPLPGETIPKAQPLPPQNLRIPQAGGTPDTGINYQALSGPLNVSDLWRFLIALLLFVIVANAVPGKAGIWYGILVLLGAMAINSQRVNELINNFIQYLQGAPYKP